MKKILLLSLAVLGFSGVSLASGVMPVPVTPDYFSGFNLGANLAVQHQIGTYSGVVGFDSTIVSEAFGSPTYTIDSATTADVDLGKTAFGGGISAGYGQTLQSTYYLGADLFGNYANSKSNLEFGGAFTTTYNDPDGLIPGPAQLFNSNVEVKTNWSYGGDIKLGYLPNPKTMIYLLAGIDVRRIDVNVTHGLLNTAYSVFPGYEARYSYSFDKTKFGFMPGVGFETMLTDKLSLVGQYTYSWFSSFGADVVPDPVAIPDQDLVRAHGTVSSSASDSVKMARGIYSLGLTYHFNGI